MTDVRFDVDERMRHGCADIREVDGWAVIECDCGITVGKFPDFVTAVDALIDHVCDRSLT